MAERDRIFVESIFNMIKDIEYENPEIIKAFQADFPTMKIKQRTHRTPAKYHTAEGEVLTRNKRKGLTYERMERFIDALPRAKVYREEYDFIKANAINPYDLTSKWFAAQFPNFRTNPLFYLNDKSKIVPAAAVLTDETTELIPA